jgi:hypothetical protein
MTECVISIVILKRVLFTLFHDMFKLVQMSGQYLNRRSAGMNYHLTTKKQQTQEK